MIRRTGSVESVPYHFAIVPDQKKVGTVLALDAVIAAATGGRYVGPHALWFAELEVWDDVVGELGGDAG